MSITEFPIATTQIEDLIPTKLPNPGKVSFNVAQLAAGGSGTYASPWTGWDTAIEALFGPNRTFYFPSGVYGYVESPNFGIHGNVHYRGEHGTVLKYTGSGRCVELISTQPAQQPGVNTVFGIIFENFIIDGTGVGTVGMYTSSIHHSVFRNIFIRDVTDIGYHSEFAVLNTYDTIHVTNGVGESDGTGYNTNPDVGFKFDCEVGNTINATQACSMINLIAESCGDRGIWLAGANQNTFIGGSAEYNGDINFYISGVGNTVIGMDNEFPTGGIDFYIHGNYHRLINCLGTHTIRIGNDVDGAQYIGNEIIGGHFNTIIVDINAKYTKLDRPAYNFSGTGVFYNNSNSTIVVGPPINYDTLTARNLALDIPGHAAVRGDLQFLHGYGPLVYTPDGTAKRIVCDNAGVLSTVTATTDMEMARSDNFSAADSQWKKDSFVLLNIPSSAVAVALASNALSITPPNTTGGNNFAGYGGPPRTLADGGYEQIHLVSRPTTGLASLRTMFWMGKSGRNGLVMYVDEAGSLIFAGASGGSSAPIASTVFNATTMQYWRFRRSGITIIAEYSQTGLGGSWTALGTAATPATYGISFSKYRVCIEAGSIGSATFDAPVVFDDYVYSHG